MAQSEALAAGKSLGNYQFKASTGWVDNFQKRHNIVLNGVCGESKDLDESVVSSVPTSIVVKGEKRAGGKMSKERITVLLHENMVGKMEKPLETGKVAKPRCFKNLKINNLPVIWRNNKKAWMTAASMEGWLNMFNAKMKKENRNVIPFLDSATCHPKVTLSNVKIAWFPAKALSVLQPMDMGVIYTFRLHYRQFLLQSLISNLEADSAYTLSRSVSVLDAVNLIGLAVKKSKAETVKRCFAKAEFW
jgi:hypothetical protein